MIGNIRKVDKEGRISIPKDYRDYLGIKPFDLVEKKIGWYISL